MASKKALTGRHIYAEFKEETINQRVQKMIEMRNQVDVEKAHVKFSFGNRKTGALVPSVSLIPVADCPNCKACKLGCYDIRHTCCYEASQRMRANNSAILHNDKERYFAEVYEQVRYFRWFRYHGGGDLTSFWDWEHIVDIARRVPTCDFLIFTKMFGIVNRWIDKNGELPDNLHVIFSDWRGQRMDNPHNLPVSSPLWKDGTKGPNCTEDAVMCPGDCSRCATIGQGCWTAKKGQTILFEAH